jgi:hypothetical protein
MWKALYKLLRLSFICLAALVSFAAPVAAQDLLHPSDSVHFTIARSGGWNAGKIDHLNGDSLFLRACDTCGISSVSIASTRAIEIWHPGVVRDGNMGENVAVGALTGTVGGALIGGLLFRQTHCRPFGGNGSGKVCGIDRTWLGGIAGLVAGTVIGAIHGHRHATEGWWATVRSDPEGR